MNPIGTSKDAYAEEPSYENAGFSLVELIIVIAIMAILVGVLAPQYIRYVEDSKRSTDIQNAVNLQSVLQAEMADQSLTGQDVVRIDEDLVSTFKGATSGNSTISVDGVPRIKGNLANDGYFYAQYDSSSGLCRVFNANPGDPPSVDPATGCAGEGIFELTNANGATSYKTAR